VGVAIPVVVRLEGTNVELGRKMLADAVADSVTTTRLPIIASNDLNEAARQAVAATQP